MLFNKFFAPSCCASFLDFPRPINCFDPSMLTEILKIGKKLDLDDANAEFIGILKLSRKGCEVFSKNYSVLKKKQKVRKMQVHDFIREIIKAKNHVQSCDLGEKFMEIDTLNDYKIAKKLFTN